MCSAKDMLSRLQSVNKITTLRDMVYDEIKNNEHILKDLKEEEFLLGDVNSNNNAWAYSKKSSFQDNIDAGYDFYIDYKHAKNPIAGYGKVDLINKGKFLNSFKIQKPKTNNYQWVVKDSKLSEIEGAYGNVRGLQQQKFEDFQVVIIKPLFIEKLKSIINKK